VYKRAVSDQEGTVDVEKVEFFSEYLSLLSVLEIGLNRRQVNKDSRGRIKQN